GAWSWSPRCHLPMSAVVYPASRSRCASVTSVWGRLCSAWAARSFRRGGPPSRADSAQVVICSRAGCLPVISAARVGEQTGALAYACVNRTPSRASRSRCGDSWYGLPVKARSVAPRSSARMTTTLSGAAVPAAARIRAAAKATAGRVMAVSGVRGDAAVVTGTPELCKRLVRRARRSLPLVEPVDQVGDGVTPAAAAAAGRLRRPLRGVLLGRRGLVRGLGLRRRVPAGAGRCRDGARDRRECPDRLVQDGRDLRGVARVVHRPLGGSDGQDGLVGRKNA